MDYSDDSFLMGDTFEEFQISVLVPVTLFTSVRFQIQTEATNLFSSQEIPVLGLVPNSNTVNIMLKTDKQEKFVTLKMH